MSYNDFVVDNAFPTLLYPKDGSRKVSTIIMEHEQYHGTIENIHRYPHSFPIMLSSITDTVIVKILQADEIITTEDILAQDELTVGSSISISEWIDEVNKHL